MEHSLQILEFNRVIDQVLPYAATSLGKEKVAQMQPSNNFDTIKNWQQITEEAVRICLAKDSAPLGGVYNIKQALLRSKADAILSAPEILEVGSHLYAIIQMKSFTRELEELGEYPQFYNFVEQLIHQPDLYRTIQSTIDDTGRVVDTASIVLRQIRAQMKITENSVREKLNRMVQTHRDKLTDGIVTIRNNRYVIPVRVDYKNTFGGMIHDQSASGSTVFIEPEAVVALNNKLAQLFANEKTEIERILRDLTLRIKVEADTLLANLLVFAEIDFMFAKARYALATESVRPQLNTNGYIHLLQARHPLIARDEVVPNDIILGKNYNAIVITGPNTGGKTVTLKTVGLLTLMAQAGLHIPAAEKSELAVFNHVFADIGDEQSIEQSLSTFSSHMKNIVQIIENLSYNSLVLFDELGSGTDPKEGSSLAIEILEYMQKKEARVIATTHYPELKAYGYENNNVINASVEFDIDTLRPTYKLLLGIPGRSNAFEISKRLGLPEFIIEKAREHAKLESSEMTETIQRLETESIKLQHTRELAQSQQAEVHALREELKLQKQSYERQKQQMIEKAKREANDYLKRAQQEADKIISDLKLVHTENVKEHELIAARTALKNARYDERRGITRPTTRVDLQVGDLVKVATLGSNGEIMRELKPGLWEVKIGRMTMKVKDEDLLFEKRRTAKEKPSKRVGIKGERQTVGMKLDLRGKRFEEAMIELDHYLDKAVLMNYPSVSIIHGHGTGAIRKGVHEHLKASRIVKTYRLGGAGEGGVGATVVEFK